MKRRTFLTVSLGAAGALRLGFSVAPAASGSFVPNVYVTLDSSGAVLVTIPMSDIGQGIGTALAMVLADELDADWSRVRVTFANADKARYGDQGIGDSRTMRKNTLKFRQAGAAARAMLVEAAAVRWHVSPESCRTALGVVYHDAGRLRTEYRSLLVAAASAPQQDPMLKTPEQFRYIGRPIGMLGAREKSTGEAKYGIDLTRPGMLVASLERAPRLGATLQPHDASAARAVAGVVDVVEIPSPPTPDAFAFVPSVAVLATSYWAASQGRKALAAAWSDGPNAHISSGTIRTELLAGLDGRALTGKATGDVDAAFLAARRIVTAVYETPLEAHATLEPQNAIADVGLDRCEIWAPTQGPADIQSIAATITGLPPEKVVVHQALAGGGFGRRSDNDYAVEAIVLSQRMKRPVKVVWSREDDLRHDTYRPPQANRLRAVLDERGNLVALEHRLASPSIGVQRGYRKRDEPDLGALEGTIDIPYAIPNYRAEFVLVDNVPVYFGWWRAVSVGQNLFATESFVDELAHEARIDPYAFRRTLLATNARGLAVLDRAAQRAGWSTPLRQGFGRGLAFAPYGNTRVAQVAEVSLGAGGAPRVERVVCAIDCGLPINPRIIEAQVQGAIVWALGATLMQEITIAEGAVVEGNFDVYPMPRMGDAPRIEVEIVNSNGDPTGVGEAGVPALAPAVCNALFALTGQRIRRLPVRMAAGTS